MAFGVLHLMDMQIFEKKLTYKVDFFKLLPWTSKKVFSSGYNVSLTTKILLLKALFLELNWKSLFPPFPSSRFFP